MRANGVDGCQSDNISLVRDDCHSFIRLGAGVKRSPATRFVVRSSIVLAVIWFNAAAAHEATSATIVVIVAANRTTIVDIYAGHILKGTAQVSIDVSKITCDEYVHDKIPTSDFTWSYRPSNMTNLDPVRKLTRQPS
jgi:hypothetical protein